MRQHSRAVAARQFGGRSDADLIGECNDSCRGNAGRRPDADDYAPSRAIGGATVHGRTCECTGDPYR